MDEKIKEIIENEMDCLVTDVDFVIKKEGSLQALVNMLEVAINYTRCCTELNNCFKKGEIVIYLGVKMRITFIDNEQKIAHMYCMCDETDWKEVSLSKLTKII